MDHQMSVLHSDIAGYVWTAIGGLLKDPHIAERTDEHTMLWELGLSSVLLITLIIQLEEHYKISFDDAGMLEENFQTVGKIKQMILAKLEPEGG
ncbi:phosphopantetheine binding protein [Fontibacillus phaseoli]|uniref:Phosphopantetheine binding protein n=1 Tax=Fontibacillus phaseoli TaxID=1416533 RepID=A0A369B9X9_9BACL|nr:acyl carrier protein [Fontibacillus phaseoli]RCX17327.1 phosphopantetheine binding protein [Fontibacillus phaseoli]